MLQSFESYPGPGCNFELFEMVVPHANFKVFKVGPSARVPMGRKENADLGHGGGIFMFHQFCCKVPSPTPGRGATLKTLKMVVPHANFKVFKVGPSARVPMGSKENDDLEHGGGALCFTNFAATFRVLPRAGVQL